MRVKNDHSLPAALADGGWGQKCIEKPAEDPNCSGNGASEQGKQRRPCYAKKQNVEYDIKQELHCFLVGFANKKDRGGSWLFTGLPAVEQDGGRHACPFLQHSFAPMHVRTNL